MSNEPTFSEFAKRLRPMVEEKRRLSADLRELMKEMREIGIEGGVMKTWIEALVEYEDTGKDTRIKKLQERTTNAAIYAEALGVAIDGFGQPGPKKPKRSVVKVSLDDIPMATPEQLIEAQPDDMPDIPPEFDRREKVSA